MENIEKLLSQLTNENKYYIKIETELNDEMMGKDEVANSTNAIIVTIIKLKRSHKDEFIYDALDFFEENNPIIARCNYGIVMSCNNKQYREDIVGDFCDYYPIYNKCLICAEHKESDENYISSVGMNLMHLIRFFTYTNFKYDRVEVRIQDEE